MTNVLNSVDYQEWQHINYEIDNAFYYGGAEVQVQWEAKRDDFIAAHNIDRHLPVTLDSSSPDPLNDYEVKAVTASGQDNSKDIPQNVIDKNQDTRWSMEVDGCWIQLDLGTSVVMGSVGITWYKGATRKSNFELEVSDDGQKFTTIASFISNQTAVMEWYKAGGNTGRYLRLVGHGNNLNEYTSITEMAVNAKDKSGEQPPPTPPPTPQGQFPVPQGFEVQGSVGTNYKFWGRTTTNYASGGSGPSLRWDCEDNQSTQVLAGYEFNLGTKHGERGDDNIDLKCRGNSHSNGKGGWYLPWISWHVNGSAGETGCGKELPHPTTNHMAWNEEDKKVDVGNIKDGAWHGFLVAVFNDKDGVPTMMAWYNPTASGKISDYEYLGKSKDKGKMTDNKVGKEVLTKIAQVGGGKQSLQVRMDEVPDAKVRNTFTYALKSTPE